MVIRILVFIFFLYSCGTKQQKTNEEIVKDTIKDSKIDTCSKYVDLFNKFPNSYNGIERKYTFTDTSTNSKGLKEEFYLDVELMVKSQSCIESKLYFDKIFNISLIDKEPYEIDYEILGRLNKEVFATFCLKNYMIVGERLMGKSDGEIYKFWKFYFAEIHPENYYQYTDPTHLIDSVKMADNRVFEIQQKAYQDALNP